MPVTFLDEEPKKSRITFLDEEPAKKTPFLPGKERVEKLISERPSQFEPFNPLTAGPGGSFSPSAIGLKLLSALSRSIEQPLANSAMALQERNLPSFQKDIVG